VDVSLVAAQAVACLFPLGDARSWRAGACLAPTLGAARAAGHGYSADAAATSAWLAAAGALVGAGPIVGPLGWRARLGGAIPLHPRAFGVDNVGTAYGPPAIAAFGDLGLSVSIR
jgi:hypothetical protein